MFYGKIFLLISKNSSFCFFVQKFNDKGEVIKRGAYGFGEAFDKNFKCRDRYHICCRASLCNKQTTAPCPPTRKYLFFSSIVLEVKKNFSCFLASQTEKHEVKACHECKGVEKCRPENLGSGDIRTSAVLGASNLYCFTVCRIYPHDFSYF